MTSYLNKFNDMFAYVCCKPFRPYTYCYCRSFVFQSSLPIDFVSGGSTYVSHLKSSQNALQSAPRASYYCGLHLCKYLTVRFAVSASSDLKDAMDPQCDIPRSRHWRSASLQITVALTMHESQKHDSS